VDKPSPKHVGNFLNFRKTAQSKQSPIGPNLVTLLLMYISAVADQQLKQSMKHEKILTPSDFHPTPFLFFYLCKFVS
jgi:hypothetical protein